jgi:Tfp pilus assembly protein PilF
LPPLTSIAAILVLAGMLLSGESASNRSSRIDPLTQTKVALSERNFAEAERGARAALVATPARADLHVLLGRALLEQGKAREARGEFETALRSDPALFEAVRGLAESLERLGQPAAALLEYERATRLRAADFRPWREYGLAAERAGDDPRATDALRRSLALEPDQPDLTLLLARIESRGHEWETGGMATMRPRPVNPEDFLPRSPAPDPSDWLPQPQGRPR